MQLPPPGARRQGQGGDPRGRRDADGVQHDRDLGRDHDGHRGDEGVAGQPRGDCRLDRAGRLRSGVRCGDRDQCLRQDDPRHRDGAGPPEPAEPDALRRLDLPRALQRSEHHHPGGVRGDRRARRRPDHRRGADRDRGGCVARLRRLWRPVHRQHDGDGVPGARDLAVFLGGSGRRPAQGRRCQGGRPPRHGCPQTRPDTQRHHHPRQPRERDRRDRVQRRLDQRRAPPARGRRGDRRRPRHRRFRPDQRAHAAAVRPQAERPVRRPGPVRGRRRPAGHEAG